MLTHPVIEKLKELKFLGMADVLTEQLQATGIEKLTFIERLASMVDREHSLRENKSLDSRLTRAKLRISEAVLADCDQNPARGLDQAILTQLAGRDWINQHRHVTITGATGTGKTYLACAIGHKACMLGFKVRYWRLSQLMEELLLSRADGRYLNLLKTTAKFDLLIVDDWGMTQINTQAGQQVLLDILDERYQRKSTLIASQYPRRLWHEQITDPTFADAILDRVLGGDAYHLELKGPSLRRQKPSSQNQQEANQTTN